MNKKMNVQRVEEFAEEMMKKIFIEANLGMSEIDRVKKGFSLSLEDDVFGLVTDNGKGAELYLKVSENFVPEFIKNGSTYCNIEENGYLIKYYSLPHKAYINEKLFTHYVKISIESAKELKKKEYIRVKSLSRKSNDVDEFFRR